MKITIPLTDYAPDKGTFGEHLLQASNVYPDSGGWTNFPAIVSASSGSVSDGSDSQVLGGIATVDDSGSPLYFIGTNTKLHTLDGSTGTDVSKVGGYTVGSTGVWDFAQFEQTVVATNYVDPPQKWVIGTSSAFADLKSSAPAAPKARHVGRIGQFIFLGDTDDGTNQYSYRVQWSAIGDPDDWPTPGTSDAQDKQSDEEFLPSEYGAVMGIAGGDEYGLVFQERAITRFDYVGGAAIFQVRTFEQEVGLLGYRAFKSVGGVTYFAGQGGFYVTDGVTTRKLSGDKVDIQLGYLLDYSKQYEWSCAFDPERDIIIWRITGARGSNNTSQYFIYSITQDQFSTSSADFMMSSGTASGAGDTAIDFIMDGPDATGSSVENRALFVGARSPAGVTIASARSAFTTDALNNGSSENYKLTTAFQQVPSGANVYINGVRLVTAGVPSSYDPTVTVRTIDTNDAYTIPGNTNITVGTSTTASAKSSRTGIHHLRATGRYFSVELSEDDNTGSLRAAKALEVFVEEVGQS